MTNQTEAQIRGGAPLLGADRNLHALNDRFIPAALMHWANGLKALTVSEIEALEVQMGETLVAFYCAEQISRDDMSAVLECWRELKADELAYLGTEPRHVCDEFCQVCEERPGL